MILLDEPFSALDVHTRRLMQNELLRLWTEQKISVVFITHDLEEAIALSDRVAVMAAGPASRIVASFPVDLVRPRDVAEILLNADFRRIYGDIWNVLRGEVQKTYQRHV
jgi:NitT/TauT family transport system ATP-binding protein